MPTHCLKISTKMVCGGCTGTIEKALLSVPGVATVSVSLETQSAKVETTDDEIACKCTKKADGTCQCGENCKCMEKALLAACEDVGFSAHPTNSSIHKCGDSTSSKKGSCGSPGCTCGDNCLCGDSCKCAGCPGSTSCGKEGLGPCNSPNCTCGPNCQCGENCACTTCPKASSGFQNNMLVNIAAGVALFAVGWMAGKRFS